MRRLALALLFLSAVLPANAQQMPGQDNYDSQYDSLFRFYLKIINIELTEGSKAHVKYPSMYYVAYIDTNYYDTLYMNIYMEDAIKFLELETNIYLRRGKFGGEILTRDIYDLWNQWYLRNVRQVRN